MMKKQLKRAFTVFLAALILSMTLGLGVFAAGADTDTFDFWTSQAVTAERGGSTQIKLFASEKFKVFLTGATSQDTFAVFDNGQNIGNASVTVYIGADEQARNIKALFYVYDREFYDNVSIDIVGPIAPAPVIAPAPIFPAAAPAAPVGAQVYSDYPGDYIAFNEKVAQQVLLAQPGSTVTLNTGSLWSSFCGIALRAIDKRPDVTVVLNFIYDKVPYSVTIPAGTNASALADANGYCGFLYLASLFH